MVTDPLFATIVSRPPRVSGCTVALIAAGAPWAPMLSRTATVICSGAELWSRTERVARSLSTWFRGPVIVSLVVPDPETPGPVAVS